ncbi:MAG TPA: aromatic amino acid ammonia-lyase [Pyrinomonadaceae bacterium]|jgi:phenylalanine ammonia-lyase|nr:aromatic amino acid ammonia-lyase [Pyrinomonadaceae bacterium]
MKEDVFATALQAEEPTEYSPKRDHNPVVEISHRNQLTITNLIRIARSFLRTKIDPACRAMLARGRTRLEQKIANGETVYGVNTGFGGNSKYLIPPEQLALHQTNLLRFLSAGTGPTLSITIVRAAMIARANALAQGWSGVRPIIVERLLEVLNRRITPVVLRWGSVGASGDLVPSAQIARALLGEGMVSYRGEIMPASEALSQEGLAPLALEPKEGLGLVNGTTMMTGIAAIVFEEARYLFSLSLVAIAMIAEALKSSPDYYDARIHTIKNHPGQIAVADRLRALLEGSELAVGLEEIRERLAVLGSRARDSHTVEVASESVQSPYSLRCVPQGLGPVCETLGQIQQTIERELNSANDNPLVDPVSGDVLHSGNFYGAHIGRAMDGLKLDLCNIANWLHSLVGLLMDSRFSNGLPDSLSPQVGLYQGFKGLQLSHSSSVTAIRHLSGPSCIHTMPTEQFNQDVVSLGTHAAMTAFDIVEMLRDVVAMTLLAAAQAVDLRDGGNNLGHGTQPVFRAIRRVSSFLDEDRPLDRDIAAVSALIGRREFQLAELINPFVP